MTAAQIAGWLSDNLWTFVLLPVVVAVVVAVLTALVIFGGVHRIASVSQTAIPVVAVFYLAVGTVTEHNRDEKHGKHSR